MNKALRLLSYFLSIILFILSVDAYAAVLTNKDLSEADESSQYSTAEQSQLTTIEQLLQYDMQQALKNTKEKKSIVENLANPVMAPKLVALYGTGKSLMAEVQVGTQAYLYVRGQPYPAGYLNDKGVYRLVAMNGACIQLEKGQDKHSLCLRMLLGVG